MYTNERMDYEAPVVQDLGELKQITEAGNEINSDTAAFQDNTAFGPNLAS